MIEARREPLHAIYEPCAGGEVELDRRGGLMGACSLCAVWVLVVKARRGLITGSWMRSDVFLYCFGEIGR